MYQIHQKNKKTGVTYVYEATSYWDKDKKQARNKQVCVGKLDPETGEFIPSKRLDPKQAAARDPHVTVTTKIVGPSLLLDNITDELGLDKILKKCFPETYKQILCMAYYITSRGGPLSHCKHWSRNHTHHFTKELTSQRISEILPKLDEDGQNCFFKEWGKRITKKDYLCYDITSVSSYGELNEYLKYGYNRDGDSLKQINLAFLFDQKSQLPVYFNSLPGNINDVSTLHNLIKNFRYMEMPKLHLVMDKGFYSQQNVSELIDARDKFIIGIPSGLKIIREAIDDVRETIQNPEYYRNLEDEVLYVNTKKISWGEKNRRCYIHLYYNAHRAADATDKFTEELLSYKKELETNKLVAEHEEVYEKFFIVKETPVRGRKVKFNNEAIQKYRSQYLGFFGLLTNDIKDPIDGLIIYRNKDIIEKCFDDLKNQLDMERLRIHSSKAMNGRLFVQFIALIYISALRKKIRENDLIKKYSFREILMEMETLTQVRYSGKYGRVLTEITKPQRIIMECLGINPQA